MNNILRMIIGFAMVVLGATMIGIVSSNDLISIFFFLCFVVVGIGLMVKGLSLISTEGLTNKKDALVSGEEQ